LQYLRSSYYYNFNYTSIINKYRAKLNKKRHKIAPLFSTKKQKTMKNSTNVPLDRSLTSFCYRFMYATAYIITIIVPKSLFLKLDSVSFLNDFHFEKIKDCKWHFVHSDAIMLVLAMLSSLVHLNSVKPSAIVS